MRVMGLDLGEAQTGVAMSDPEGIIAMPVKVLDTRNPDFYNTLTTLVDDYEVARIVVGLPLSLDGAPRRQARWVKGMQREISTRLEIQVDTWDERLSTVAAQRNLRDVGGKVDEMCVQEDAAAAAFILQGYLDRQKNLSERSRGR